MKNIQYRTHQSYFCEDKEQCWTLFWAGGAKQRGAERESGRLRNHTHTLLWLWRNCCQATAPLQAWDLHMQQCYWQQLASGLWQLKGNLEAASRKALLRFASALISVWEIGLTFMLSCQFQCPKPGPALKATHPCEKQTAMTRCANILSAQKSFLQGTKKTGYVDSLIYVFKWLLAVSK